MRALKFMLALFSCKLFSMQVKRAFPKGFSKVSDETLHETITRRRSFTSEYESDQFYSYYC